MDPFSRAKEIISHVRYMAIASVAEDGQPWSAPVYFGFDKRWDLYWISGRDSQHSRNIAGNPSVFIVIYDSTAPEGTGTGVYIKARAEVLADAEDIRRACACLYGRAGKAAPDADTFVGTRPRRVYRASPENVWINSTRSSGVDLVDERVEVKLGD